MADATEEKRPVKEQASKVTTSAPAQKPRPTASQDNEPSFKSIIAAVSVVILALYASSHAMANVDRWNYVTSYPSRFTWRGLPGDVFELGTFLAPTALQHPFETARKWYNPDPRDWSLGRWMVFEEEVAWRNLKANIRPKGTAQGCIVASPSRDKPNYWYSWTRDSALVMRTVVARYVRERDPALRATIDDYIAGVREMQHKETPSGSFHTGGLGEVKFEVDNEPFTGEWGRPQNDGPALRAITLITFAEHLLDEGTEEEKRFVQEVLYDGKWDSESVIKGDLEHIAKNWAAPGFDLWEEVRGSHFYTLLSIHSALLRGSSLALRLNDAGAAAFYSKEARALVPVLEQFYDDQKNIVRVSLNQSTGRESDENAHAGDSKYGKDSELDAAIILGWLHAAEGTIWENDDRIAATLGHIVDAFRPLYPITMDAEAPGIGRYPEDQYDGIGLSVGHPWYLATCAVAEYLYEHSTRLATSTLPLVIDDATRSFYSRFLPLGAVGFKGDKKDTLIKPGSKQLQKIVDGERNLADQFIGVVQQHAWFNGSLNEQFHRDSGIGRGARDLTWSYAAFITAAEARREAQKQHQSAKK